MVAICNSFDQIGKKFMSTSVLSCGKPVEAEPVEAETTDEANAEDVAPEVSPQEHGRQSVLAWLKRTSFALSIGSASASAIAGSVLAQQAESAEEEVGEWIGDYDEPPANSAGDWTVSQPATPPFLLFPVLFSLLSLCSTLSFCSKVPSNVLTSLLRIEKCAGSGRKSRCSKSAARW